MGKDFVNIISRQIDQFIKLKYGLPKNVEGATKRIRSNFDKFSIIYTIIAIVLMFGATFFNKEFATPATVFAIFGVVAIVLGELDLRIPIGDKKYKVEKIYGYILLLLITFLMSYFTDSISTLAKAGGLTVLLELVHSLFAESTFLA